ncbi:AraC family transcriptional regulator [Bordetella ansorpii]|uniref:AraC family transcriptional regulator n=2 Tax=Bordetella ansorpii TaxID=288768 RepID=A0A157S5T6_9BORD|nr:AraC family transcriptional regulator [Bordetella ansorpii]
MVTAMAKEYVSNDHTGPHTHRRAQLVYAVSGAMRVTTPDGLWTLPPLRALWVPAGVSHAVEMLGSVSMRTLYVHADAARTLWDRCQVIEVPPLLRELILALTGEPIAYAPEGRAGQIAALLLTELRSAPVVPIQIPWPQDRRLQAICRAILDQPGLERRLEDWGDEVGASGRTLIRLFQAELGLNYRQWMQQVRLSDALHRLTLGQPVARVAAELGYSSPSAFSAMFRRALGTTPQQMRGERAQ